MAYAKNSALQRAAAKAASRHNYAANAHKTCVSSRLWYLKNVKAKAKACKKYYAEYKNGICAIRRGRHYLSEPMADVKEMCIKEI